MPAAISPKRAKSHITCFTGGRVVKGDKLVEEDIWISAETDATVDVQGKIIAPGFIDVQFNGAFGFDFSEIPEDMTMYIKGLRRLNQELVKTGVTSYLPTIYSQKSRVYHSALQYLGPSGAGRITEDGAESLGAHCEGPFISPARNGIHSPEVLLEAPNGFSDLEACYGPNNLPSPQSKRRSPISMITAAPEVQGIAATIPQVKERDIVFSVGHSDATYEEASKAIEAGASMITHLFNAMRPLHHRDPGIFGVLGKAEGRERPYYGVIADGIHLHPTTVKIAWEAHHDGFILVTDALKAAGLPDGRYDWTNGDYITKKGPLLTLNGTDKIAGSSASLVECVSNFWNWSHASLPEVIHAVTATPAKMLGLEKVKGTLEADADADLVVLSESTDDQGGRKIEVDQVWKFGSLVHDSSIVAS